VPDKTALFSFARSPRAVPLPLSRGVVEDGSLIGRNVDKCLQLGEFP